MDYDREEAKQLRMLNNSNWDIVDDGKLSGDHMWTIRITHLHCPQKMASINVLEDVVPQTRPSSKPMASTRRWNGSRPASARASSEAGRE